MIRIGLTESIDEFIDEVTRDMAWPTQTGSVRENITQNFYGLDLADSETRAVLWPLVQHDMALYQHIAQSRG